MGKHHKVNRWEKYSDEGESDSKMCPRCQSMLAVHSNRETCGNCGYSKIEK